MYALTIFTSEIASKLAIVKSIPTLSGSPEVENSKKVDTRVDLIFSVTDFWKKAREERKISNGSLHELEFFNKPCHNFFLSGLFPKIDNRDGVEKILGIRSTQTDTSHAIGEQSISVIEQ